MRFAHFTHLWGKPGLTPHERYELLWRELQAAEETGFDYGFTVEHHFTPQESWMSSPNLYVVAAGARTSRLRLGAMGHVAPLHHPLRLLEEIALTDQMTGGRVEVGLVPGIQKSYFDPFGIEYGNRREVTLEMARFMQAAFSGGPLISYDSKLIRCQDVALSVRPLQQPYPPMWLETRDVPTLELCAQLGLSTGYFLLFPRKTAQARYRPYIEGWKRHGHPGVPRIAYSTVVYVDETDELAAQNALADAGRAYKGLFSYSEDPDEIRAKQVETADYFRQRNEPGSAEIVMNLLDARYLLEHDLVLIGSPATVARKLRAWAEEGSFNTFFGEFNFGSIADADVLRSIRLFGTEVIPQLRDFEPVR